MSEDQSGQTLASTAADFKSRSTAKRRSASVASSIVQNRILCVVAYNCNHDHSKFSQLIPIELSIANFSKCNVPNIALSILAAIEKRLSQLSMGPPDLSRYYLRYARCGTQVHHRERLETEIAKS